ncbi:hypothetical protein HMI54_014835, partial [Coelomomyces lativittatus]
MVYDNFFDDLLEYLNDFLNPLSKAYDYVNGILDYKPCPGRRKEDTVFLKNILKKYFEVKGKILQFIETAKKHRKFLTKNYRRKYNDYLSLFSEFKTQVLPIIEVSKKCWEKTTSETTPTENSFFKNVASRFRTEKKKARIYDLKTREQILKLHSKLLGLNFYERDVRHLVELLDSNEIK